MEESTKRRERLKAMRMEASHEDATYNNDHSAVSLANPLLESTLLFLLVLLFVFIGGSSIYLPCFISGEFSMNEITTAGGEIQLIHLSNLSLQLFFTSGACLRSNHHFSP
ncbi:hypothetical protein Hanom_Chr04g00285981 [Helianthus anomalus]